MGVAGLVLAAGEGRRFGGPKAPYVLDGERLVDRAVRLLREGGAHPVVVVLGAWIGDDVPADEVVVNSAWREGMGSSLRVGLEHLAATDDDVDAVVVALVDLVGLTVSAVQRIVAADSPLAAAAYDGRRGHPVRVGREHWRGVIESAHGDIGARDYLATHDVLLVEVGDVASGDDLDARPA